MSAHINMEFKELRGLPAEELEKLHARDGWQVIKVLPHGVIFGRRLW